VTSGTQSPPTKPQEADFLPKLELFGIEAIAYKELDWVDQEMDKLNYIWEVRQSWDSEKAALLVAKFNSLNTDELDELAMQFQGRMRKLVGRDKQSQNWPVFQDLKSDLDLFRNTMPLIQNLRQESMRDRHFQAIIKEVKQEFDPRRPPG